MSCFFPRPSLGWCRMRGDRYERTNDIEPSNGIKSPPNRADTLCSPGYQSILEEVHCYGPLIALWLHGRGPHPRFHHRSSREPACGSSMCRIQLLRFSPKQKPDSNATPNPKTWPSPSLHSISGPSLLKVPAHRSACHQPDGYRVVGVAAPTLSPRESRRPISVHKDFRALLSSSPARISMIIPCPFHFYSPNSVKQPPGTLKGRI